MTTKQITSTEIKQQQINKITTNEFNQNKIKK
jgi:hypothetical protein